MDISNISQWLAKTPGSSTRSVQNRSAGYSSSCVTNRDSTAQLPVLFRFIFIFKGTSAAPHVTQLFPSTCTREFDICCYLLRLNCILFF